MIQHVPPQGRLSMRMMRIVRRCVLAGIIIALVAAATGLLVGPLGTAGVVAALVVFAISCVVIARRARDRAPSG
jgi:hypothetical protein